MLDLNSHTTIEVVGSSICAGSREEARTIMPLRLNIITPEHRVYSEDVDMVIAPGVEGILGILPHHAPLLTALTRGVVRVRNGDEEESFVISGGLMEVHPGWVTVLAYTNGQSVEIGKRAETRQRLTTGRVCRITEENVDFARAEAALRRAMMHINVTKLRRRKAPPRIEFR
jgi:F-type H+-transporting ATPase subunit epsilon